MAPNSLHPPPSVVASWPHPNYVSPDTRGPGLTVIGILLSAIALLLVLARLWSRLFITRAPGLDDLFAVFALAGEIGLLGLIIGTEQEHGLGRHIWDVPPEWAVTNRKLTWAGEWLYVVSSGCVKISVLLFYKRLSAPFTKMFLFATWIGIIYNVIYVVSFCLVLIFICRPTDSYWNSFNPYWLAKGHKFSCGREEISLPLSGVFSVLGDFYSTVLPLLLVWNLQLPKRQKLALYTLFALGFIVVAAGIIRTYYLDKVINHTFDVLWYLWTYYVWAVIELTLAIIAASAPALKPFLRRFLIEPIVSARSGRSHQRYGYGYTISSSGHRKSSYAGSYSGNRNSRAESLPRVRDNKEVDIEERRLDDIPESPNFDGSTIGTAITWVDPIVPSAKDEYELLQKRKERSSSPQGIKLHTTYEVTSEVADDDIPPHQSGHIRDGPFVPSPGRALPTEGPRSKSREASGTRRDSGASSIGNTTLNANNLPPEQVPWDPAERVKYYTRQTST